MIIIYFDLELNNWVQTPSVYDYEVWYNSIYLHSKSKFVLHWIEFFKFCFLGLGLDLVHFWSSVAMSYGAPLWISQCYLVQCSAIGCRRCPFCPLLRWPSIMHCSRLELVLLLCQIWSRIPIVRFLGFKMYRRLKLRSLTVYIVLKKTVTVTVQ